MIGRPGERPVRIALFSPLPPAATGIADYSRLLTAALRPHCPVEAYAGDETQCGAVAECRPWPDFAPSGDGGNQVIPVYQMGNSSYHDFLYPLIALYPGVLVLHDLVLHHSRLAHYLGTPEVAEYRRDMGDVAKRARALARLADYQAEVEATYPGRGKTVAEIALRMGGGRLLYEFPLHESLVRRSLMTLVHSPAARDEVRERCPGAVVRAIRMGIETPLPVAPEEARGRLGLAPGLILASFGLITPEKRIDTALGCLRRLVDQGIDARYLLVGSPVPHYDARQQAQSLGVASRVEVVGRVSDEDFWLYACAADLCLNLRYPSAGETSATLLRLLAAGKPVLVTDQKQQLDLPESVVARVSLAGEAEGLYCDVMDLVRQPDCRRRLSERAREFARAEHSAEAMAEDYLRCLEEIRELTEAGKH